MINYNPFTFEERVQKLVARDNSILFDLEEIKPRIAVILLMTDENRMIHVYVNGERSIISGQASFDYTGWLVERLEVINKGLKKKFHIVRVEAFLPFQTLRRLYFPRNFIPKQNDYSKRLFKASKGSK